MRAARALRRTAWQALPTMIGVLLFNFALMEWVPGDAADVIAAESGAATVESMSQLRTHLGLDLPALARLLTYLSQLAQFDLGLSARHGVPVLTLIGERLGSTLVLMLSALGLALAGGVLTGVLMAVTAGRWLDRVLSVLVLLFYSTPAFWLGLMAIVLFSVHLGWLPTGGSHTIGSGLQGWSAVLDSARYLVLPALTTAAFFMAIFARLTRASMLEVVRQDYVRTAQAKGVGPVAIVWRHVLRNALIPVTTVAGMHFGALLGGAVVIETVFSWPGLGRLALESVQARDYPVLLGILLCGSMLVILANLLVDLLHAALDPRIHVR